MTITPGVYYLTLYERLYTYSRYAIPLALDRLADSDRRVLDVCEIDDRCADDCHLYAGKGAES